MIGLVRRRTRFSPPPGEFERQLIPVLSVMIASMMPLLPVVATAPLLPPFGLMALLAWRLLRPDLWPVWAALPLGLFDDLFSGQPLGSGVALWTLAFLAVETIDRRMVWRDHWQDWGIAVALIAGVLVLGLVLATIAGGATPLAVLLPQIALSALLFPLVARACAALDRRRSAR